MDAHTVHADVGGAVAVLREVTEGLAAHAAPWLIELLAHQHAAPREHEALDGLVGLVDVGNCELEECEAPPTVVGVLYYG